MKKNKLKRFVVNLLVMMVTFMILFGLVEIGFRIFAPQNLTGSWTMLDEDGLMMNKPNWNSRHQLFGRTVHYRFNSQHLRGGEIDTTAYKILCLGDSFTFGWLLEERKTYVGLLDSLANSAFPGLHIQVLNGGVGGYGMADYTELLQRIGPAVQPDMVLVFFNGGDLNRSLDRKAFQLQAGKGLKAILNDNKSYQWLLEHSHLVQWIKSKAISTYLPMPGPMLSNGAKIPFDSSIKALTPSAVQRMDTLFSLGDSMIHVIDDWCQQHDAAFVITTTGFLGYDPFAPPMAEEIFVREMNAHIQGTSAIHLDISPGTGPPLMRDPQAFIIAQDQHPNEAGAALIANETWKQLRPVMDSLLFPRETPSDQMLHQEQN